MRARWEVEREVDGIDKGEGREESRKVEEKEEERKGCLLVLLIFETGPNVPSTDSRAAE